MNMNYNEWAKTRLDLEGDISGSEAFEAGKEVLKAHIRQLWREAETFVGFVDEVKLLADVTDE